MHCYWIHYLNKLSPSLRGLITRVTVGPKEDNLPFNKQQFPQRPNININQNVLGKCHAKKGRNVNSFIPFLQLLNWGLSVLFVHFCGSVGSVGCGRNQK